MFGARCMWYITGWQPRQKVHYTQHNSHQPRAADVPVSLPSLSPTKAAAAPAPTSSAVKTLPAATNAKSNAFASASAVAAPAVTAGPTSNGSGGGGGAHSSFEPVRDTIRVGIVPGLDAANERKTGLRTVKLLPANTKIVKPRKTAAPSAGTLATTSSLTDAAIPNAGASLRTKAVGKRVFSTKYQTNSEETSIEMAVGHKYRGYTTDEKRNGIGPGGDRGFTAVEFSDRFFESGASGPTGIRWVPTKQQRAAQKLKDHYTQAGQNDQKDVKSTSPQAQARATSASAAAATGARPSGAGSRLSRTAASVTAPPISPSKAQQARAAAEQAAINAILYVPSNPSVFLVLT